MTHERVLNAKETIYQTYCIRQGAPITFYDFEVEKLILVIYYLFNYVQKCLHC